MITPCRACCVGNLFVPDDFNPLVTFFATDKFLFVMNCPPGSDCGNLINPGFIPAPPPPNQAISMCNTAQTATVIIAGVSHTVTIPAGVFCTTLQPGSSAGGITQIQNNLNGQALGQAVAQAAGGAVFYCNDQQSGSLSCVNDPSITVTGSIPRCIFASTNPGDYPDNLNRMAQNALTVQLQNMLHEAGCTCAPIGFGTGVGGATVVNLNECTVCYDVRAANGNLIDPIFHQLCPTDTQINFCTFYYSNTGDTINQPTYFDLGGGIKFWFNCQGQH